VIRYADVLLMLAEANIFQGKVDAALPLINQVRARVGAFKYTTLGAQANAVVLLQRERQLELAGEQTRYFDLVRWGAFKSVINTEKNAIRAIYTTLKLNPVEDKHLLFPIPQAEKDANPTVAGQVSNGWN
jgi:multidrug efflux pump subunit AcrA (membrane-fusion protein)